MADVQITKAELKDGVLTVQGVGFTRTTTKIYVDGEPVPIETGEDFDGSEVTARVEGRPREIYAVKNYTESERVQIQDRDQDGQQGPTGGPTENQASDSAGQSGQGEAAGSGEAFDPGGDVHRQGYKTETPNQTPGDLVEDDLKTTSDVSQADLNRGASAGAQEKQAIPEPNREPYAPGEHLDHDFRTRVENTKVVTIEEQGIGPRDPYPEGNPPDPEQEFQELHGYPRPEPDDDQGPQTGAVNQAAASAPQRRTA